MAAAKMLVNPNCMMKVGRLQATNKFLVALLVLIAVISLFSRTVMAHRAEHVCSVYNPVPCVI